ncbi:Crp/Fnr family transcriptional regulator [Bernardetia sp.]|uniref:Crp/Fnr family transcriptional regulator n=1 Tax=Bernardetia sp. TaxID=1937974 RepID=UPI0025C4D9E8|nr:Crp/Fnr family transcriptional regulator [Bernardetia sp.]
MIDLEKLNHYFGIFKGLGLQDLKDMFASVSRKKLAPLEFFIEEGETKRQIAYVKKGLIRSFLVNEKGEEVTTMVRWEDQFFSSHDIILHNSPSRFYYQALEKTELLVVDYDLAQEIMKRNPKLEQGRKYFLLDMLKESIERVESFILYSPEERYIEFVKAKPDIVNRVPDKYIATILGMTPVSLSRIRKRIATKEMEQAKRK